MNFNILYFVIETTLVAQKKSCAASSNSGLFRGEGEKKINAFLPSAAFLPPPIHFSILAERSISAYNCVSKAKMPGVSKTNIQFNPFLSTATRAPWPFALRASLIVFFGLKFSYSVPNLVRSCIFLYY